MRAVDVEDMMKDGDKVPSPNISFSQTVEQCKLTNL